MAFFGDFSLDPDLEIPDTQCIDFSNNIQNIEISHDNKYNYVEKEIVYMTANGHPIKYDKQTELYYRIVRKTKVDPIIEESINEIYSFKFKYQWDPYTGDRTIIDPNGPFHFDPDCLIRYFYGVRLNNLWNVLSQDFEGYYGDAVSNGPDFHIIGRGTFPDYNIFRLPIVDCYLTDDHNKQIVTIGPLLTNDEIIEIANLAKKKDAICGGGDNYKKVYKKDRPNLILMKRLWDIATSKCPPLSDEIDTSKMSEQQIKAEYERISKEAVVSLRKM